MAFTDKTQTIDVARNWPYDFQRVVDGEPIYDFITPFATEFRQIDVFIDELYEQRFLETATGRELEKLAQDVGVNRLDNEDDEELRYRTRVRKLVAASDGTADDIQLILETAFEDKDLGAIDVEHDAGHPVTRFTIPTPYLDDIPLDRQPLEREIERAFPAGFGVLVVEGDTFLFGESGSQGLGQGELI